MSRFRNGSPRLVFRSQAGVRTKKDRRRKSGKAVSRLFQFMSDWLSPAICVIGGGPAGAAAARRLAQQGHSVVIVEKRLFPTPHIGETLSPGMLPLLDVLGIKERIEHQGVPASLECSFAVATDARI